MATLKSSRKLPLHPRRSNSIIQTVIIYALIGLAVLLLMASFSGASPKDNSTPISQIVNDIKDQKVQKLIIEGDKVLVEYKEEANLPEGRTHKEAGESIYKILESSSVDPNSVTIEIKDLTWQQIWLNMASIFLPIIVLVILFFFIFRQAREGAQGIFAFGQSRAKMYTKDSPQIKFSDVAGAEEAKKELSEIVDFLKNPEKYKSMGARVPKGVLLIGPPGTGKTLMARAVAGEAGVPFFSIAGSEFMEMLVGVGASVKGDTPILIKDQFGTRLIPISELVDQFYQKNEHGSIKKVKNIQTLGFEAQKNGFWGTKNNGQLVFAHSSWKSVQAVYRHKARQIYEIEYLGGKLQTTGDHSVFVRTRGRIVAKKVSELKNGDLLVELPLNIREWNYQQRKTIHHIKAHQFNNPETFYLDFWNDDKDLQQRYVTVLTNPNDLNSYQLAAQIGVSQTTILNWQKGIHTPQLLSKKLVKLNLPEKVQVAPELVKLLGYYTAEGRGTGNLEFTFGTHEPDVYTDCIKLMKAVFGIDPVIIKRADNSVKILYYSHHLGRFFARICGNGSHNKHIPEFLWALPREYFLNYLEGYSKGDGYITKSGKLSMTSVSHRLIRELAWLCSMHGIKVGIKHEYLAGGRVIVNKPLPDGECWVLIIGRTANPFLEKHKYPYQFKRAIIKKITRKKFNGFVYDLCGVDNEAFFGGEKPVLLHNSRVRDLFSQAKKNSPAIIFVDEIESIGRMRGMGISGGHDEREQTLNQILVEMDGFTPNDKVIIVAATNRPDLLDPALVRPGRFDRRVVLGLPDLEDRKALISLYMKGKPFTEDIDVERLARRTVGFSGADIANMLNESAILAAREGKKAIDTHDLEEAATKEKMGTARKRMQSLTERNLAAYHEAGHAIVGHFLPHVDPVHRISIVSRGVSGGHTMFPPTEDRSNETRSRLVEQIATALGGQASEEIFLKDLSTGATADIESATAIAKAMVTQYGMSDIGPINVTARTQISFMRGFDEGMDISPELHDRVDKEIKKLIDKGFDLAKSIIRTHRTKLEKVAIALLEKETLDGAEFEALVGKKKVAQ